MSIRPGQTFLVPSGPGKKHLFFVVPGPLVLPQHGSQEHFVMAGATTIYKGVPYDDACLLRPGDHPFFRHDSYILYRKIRLQPAANIEHLSKGWGAREDCSPDLLERIVAGIFVSRRTPRYILDALNSLPFGNPRGGIS